MMKELEKVMIEDAEYSYDPEKEYIKDGHTYCKTCNEKKSTKGIYSWCNKETQRRIYQKAGTKTDKR